MAEFTVSVLKQVPVTTLRAEMGVRYWEDGKVNGVEDNDNNPQMPMKKGAVWALDIDLATGKIADWPEGTTAETHYKGCDAGVYKALNPDGDIVAEIDGYVPPTLDPNADGYGDYVILNIDANGIIQGWFRCGCSACSCIIGHQY